MTPAAPSRGQSHHPWPPADASEPGTCYLASSEESAARERVGTQLRRVAGQESIASMLLDTPEGPVSVTRVELHAVRAANLPVKAAQRWANRSLSVGTGIYAVTQALIGSR